VELPGLTRPLASRLDDVARSWSVPLRRGDKERPDEIVAQIDEVARWCGSVLQAVVELVPEAIDELIMIPVGWLTTLPWHAAIADGDPIIERYAIRYLHTLSGLQNTLRVQMAASTTVVTPFTADLPFTEAEGVIVGALAGARRVFSAGADREAVLDDLSGSTVAHLATHCTSGPTAETSFIELNPQRLSADDARRMSYVPRDEGYLSACASGLIAVFQPDERTGFEAALFSVGFQRVLSTPWPVGDASAAFLAIAYSAERFAHRATAPSRCLQQAVNLVRRSSAAALVDWLRHLRHLLSPTAADAAHQLQRLEWWLQLQFPPAHVPFAHPAAWGGIQMSGS